MTYDVKHTSFTSISEEPESLEQLGSKKKFWLPGNRFLFKQGRQGTGEDWAEVTVGAICQLLQIPSACYCFAQAKDGRHGVLTRSIVPDGGRLIHGNELLLKVYKDYNPNATYKQRAYRLISVLALFRILEMPAIELLPPLSGRINHPKLAACDYFMSYLMLDALIGNQDRHHENWGIIAQANEKPYLAETFDHASSLGRELTDQRREQILLAPALRGGLKNYCERARTPFYEDPAQSNRLKTLDAFKRADNWEQKSIKYWLSRLELINDNSIQKIFDELPTISTAPSPMAKEFAQKMILENKNRLLALVK